MSEAELTGYENQWKRSLEIKSIYLESLNKLNMADTRKDTCLECTRQSEKFETLHDKTAFISDLLL